MERLQRTHHCAELRADHAGTEAILNGWVHRTRDHGGLRFIDVRDWRGMTQVVVGDDAPDSVAAVAAELKSEYCVAIRGIVHERPETMRNPDLATGAIEVRAVEIVVLSVSATPPFVIDEVSEARDDLRLKYRYLDLRSFSMQRKLRLRHTVLQATRAFLSAQGFVEIETPTLIRSTPEGARDFLVPSRLHPGRFYALPQSPQLFKQILMVSGFDRYFQIAHCFRDEDARGDRQIEHSQIDIEMSFVRKEDVFAVVEGLIAAIFRAGLGIELETPFRRLTYHDAMNTYGSDRPDLRFALELVDFTAIGRTGRFGVFTQVAESGGVIKALRVPGAAGYSRKRIEELEAVAKTYGARGLAWMKVAGPTEAPVLEGGIAKFFVDRSDAVLAATAAEPGDLLLFVADRWRVAATAAGAVRARLGADLGLAGDGFRFAWVVDFPLFEWDEEHQAWAAAHHMFTMPQARYLDTLESDPGAVTGELYDLVGNGLELASGSIRIHDAELQERIFRIVGFSREEARRRFGFLLDAFAYGPPPHGGIAPGLDRLVMLMAGEDSIREVIAFPKTVTGASPMDDAPGAVDAAQLAELGLQSAPRRSDA